MVFFSEWVAVTFATGLSETEVQLAWDRAVDIQSAVGVSGAAYRSWSALFAKCAVVAGVICLAAAFVKVEFFVYSFALKPVFYVTWHSPQTKM